MSEIKNSGLDQYGGEPCEQQQFGTAGVEVIDIFVKQTHGARSVYDGGDCGQRH